MAQTEPHHHAAGRNIANRRRVRVRLALLHQDLQPTERPKVGAAVDERPIYIRKHLIRIETLLSELIGIYSRPPRWEFLYIQRCSTRFIQESEFLSFSPSYT